MDSTIRNKLERWTRQQVLALDEDKGRCKKFVVRHVAGGKAGTEVGTIVVPKKLEAESWFVENVAILESMIYDDAEGLGGVQTYVILPFFENRPDKPGSRFTIRESAGDGIDSDDVESEPPTKSGVLTQMMRHTEAATRMSLMSSTQIMTILRNTVSRQAETIEKLVAEKMATIDLMERMRSEELERRLLVENTEREAKNKAELMDKIGMLVPVVINRLAGKSVVPGGTSPMEGLIKGLIESMQPDQIEKLQGVLTPTQMVSLMEIFQAVQPPENSGNGAATKQ